MNPPSAETAPAQGGAKIRLLFRQQAVDFQRQKPYGTVLLLRPLSHRLLTATFSLFALALIVFFMGFSTTRKAHVQGLLLPDAGVIRVQSSQAGQLSRALVHEGQKVRRGELMFVLNTERSNADAGSAERAVAELLRQRHSSFAQELRQSGEQAQQKALAQARREEDLQSELGQLAGQVSLQQQRVSLAEQAYHRFEELRATSFVSAALLQDKQAELLDQRQRLADLLRMQLSKKSELSGVQAERQEGRLQAQREAQALQRSAAAVEQELTENEARSQTLIRAPQDGIVTAIGVTPGQVVTPAVVLASLLPEGAQLEAEVYAPSRAVGFITPGMDVLVRYQAYPHQKFGQHHARVKEITHTSMPSEELPAGLASVFKENEPLYKIRLSLDRQAITAYGKDVPLKSGMLLDASVQLETRRLYEWAIEPLFSITGRL